MNPTEEEEEAMDGIQWDDGSVSKLFYCILLLLLYFNRIVDERESCSWWIFGIHSGGAKQ